MIKFCWEFWKKKSKFFYNFLRKKTHVASHIVQGDAKAAFTQFQRNILIYEPYSLKMFEWISIGIESEEERKEALKLLSEEYMYLVSLTP